MLNMKMGVRFREESGTDDYSGKLQAMTFAAVEKKPDAASPAVKKRQIRD